MPVTWLHVSDFHIRGGDSYERDLVLHALVDAVRDLRRRGRAPDLIFATGDIAFSGKEAEYALATNFFDRLLDAAGVERRHLFVIAGNHDVDRTLGVGLARTLTSRKEADTYFDPGAPKPHLKYKLGAFAKWFNGYFYGIRAMPETTTCGPVEAVEVRGVKIGVLPINSALFCQDDHDHAKLWIGRRCLNPAIDELQRLNAHLNVALVHHPLEWLSDRERSNIRTDLYAGVDVLLRGHLHETDVESAVGAQGGLLHVAAGAAYQTLDWPNRAVYGTFTGQDVELFPIRYEDQPQEIWTVDPSLFPREPGYTKTFSIPRLTFEPTVPGSGIGGTSNAPVAAETRERVAIHKPPRNLPPRQNTFAGRASELRELHEQLGQAAEVGITQQTAVHGHGGIGKTSLAVEYAWLHLSDYPGGAFFLSCDSDLPPRLDDLAPYLGMERSETAEETALRVKGRLETGEPCLLILDNVRGPEQWRNEDWNRLLPGEACRRLITTRAPSLAGVAMYPLQRLTREDGLRLLAEYRADVEQNAELAAAVVEWFDGLAVGLTVVGVYMATHPDLSWERYVESLEKKGLGTVRLTEQAVAGLANYEGRVDAVFDDLLQALPRAERRALEYAALLPKDQVWVPWLVELLESDKDVETPDLPGYEDHPAEQLIGALIRKQLLKARGEEQRSTGLHRVLRRRVRERLAESGGLAGLIDRVVELAERRGPASHAALTQVELRSELAPLGLLSRELDVLSRPEAAASIANWLTTPLSNLGRYAEARGLLEPFASDARLKELSATEAAILLSNLAVRLQDLGELTEARQRMEQAIHLRERHFGPEDPALATSYSNLATILRDLGELAEARRRMEQAIEISEHHFEPDDPGLATNYSNLATILYDLGEWGEARWWMERAIEIQERHFDPDHPVLAISYSNLGVVLKNLGELAEARRRIEQAIKIEEQRYDPDHPALATSYSNLAMVLRTLGELAEARRWMEQAIKIEERHFDPDHPTLATSYSNLATILTSLGRLPEARRRMEQAIEIEEAHFDPNHPARAISYYNLGSIELASGNRERACELFHRARAIVEKHFPPTHQHAQMIASTIKQACGSIV